MLFLQAALLGTGAYHLFKTTNKTIFFIYELTKGDHIKFKRGIYSQVMMFNVTFNNISVISSRSVLLMQETGVPVENHRSVAKY
jgi:hypothetical protein